MGNTQSDKIHQAIKISDVNMLKKCIARGVNINKKDKSGLTPIQFAVSLGNYDIIKELVINGAELNDLFGHNHMTPLHHAVHHKNLDVIILLTSNGAKVDIKDLNGQTSIDIAELYEFDDIVSYLKT